MANHQLQIEDSYHEQECVQSIINRHVPIMHNLHYRKIFLFPSTAKQDTVTIDSPPPPKTKIKKDTEKIETDKATLSTGCH